MPHFNMHNAKTELSRLVRRAEDGEMIIICRSGKPIVRLQLLDSAGQDKPEKARPKHRECYEPKPPDCDDPHLHMEVFD